MQAEPMPTQAARTSQFTFSTWHPNRGREGACNRQTALQQTKEGRASGAAAAQQEGGCGRLRRAPKEVEVGRAIRLCWRRRTPTGKIARAGMQLQVCVNSVRVLHSHAEVNGSSDSGRDGIPHSGIAA